ncbi:MAG: DUF4242 domain-containing protein [Desulfobacter postgatei]|jgi:hypothetical protein|uniref:DUF4242 domain-containing protein n=1 Tax=Desulfobacter postgatei TaxID=2293 RepID=UPI0023F10F96|nr:DUF4242 domain-containing protein [Desulfobacter postgatei]MDD4274479.1 DUF4242 domain-containing protein [Desulfobacter postgatei]
MSKTNKYMMIHNSPEVDWEVVKENWRKLAGVEAATWIKTYYNKDKGMRFCIWLAPTEEILKDIFTEIGISWESITLVEETVPDVWNGNWAEDLAEAYDRSEM